MSKEKQEDQAQDEQVAEPTVEEVQASIETGETAVNEARDALISVDTTDPKALREASVTLSRAVTALNKDRRILKRLQGGTGVGGTGSRARKVFIAEMLTTGPQTQDDIAAAVNEKFGEDSFQVHTLKALVRDLRKTDTFVETTTYYIASKPPESD